MLDKKDKLILAQLQDDFPLDPRPYTVIAKRLRMSPSAIAARVRMFRKKGIIRYIGAVLDTKRIGFRSSLVALAVPQRRIREVAGIVNSYPEVTHNYLRGDEYNMWFTVSCRTDRRRLALVRQICRDTGISRRLDLATIKVFKINARFPLVDRPRQGKRAAKISSKGSVIQDRRVLSLLGCALDNSDRPFLALASRIGCTESAVADLIARAMEKKLIRRFGAVLDHYKIGLTTNALVAWQVDKNDMAAAAKAMAEVKYISHCYWRKTHPGWPYSLYTMIHAPGRKACCEILQLILHSLEDTIKGMRVLYTVRELKKTRFDAHRLAHNP